MFSPMADKETDIHWLNSQAKSDMEDWLTGNWMNSDFTLGWIFEFFHWLPVISLICQISQFLYTYEVEVRKYMLMPTIYHLRVNNYLSALEKECI